MTRWIVAVIGAWVMLVPAAELRSQVGAWQPQPAQPRRPAAGGTREPYVSVVDFGASGKDNRWDHEAIQRAIDSLPRPSMPGGKDPAGGVVVLPAGRYYINRPLRMFNGVTLRGEGAGTVIHKVGDEPAVLLVSPFGHRYVASAVVEDLCIYTDSAAAISVDENAGALSQCRFENLLLNPGGCAIDLDPGLKRRVYTQNTIIRNVHISQFGGPALTLWGNANHIEMVNTEGGTRKGFKAEPAIVTIAGGGNNIRGCIIEANTPNPAVGFHVSGVFTWQHNWTELDPVTDGIAYIFQDVELAQIDYLHHILPWHKAKFVNCQSMLIRTLNLDGELSSLAQNIELDEQSNLRIDQVIARTDAGMLDDPRVSIGSIYNRTGKYRLDLPLRGEGTPLLSAGAEARQGGGWSPRWDTPKGRIKGSIHLEEATDEHGPRLRVEVNEAPPEQRLAVEKAIEVPPALEGKQGIITWRVEGPGQVVVIHDGREIPSRAMGSLTANPASAPLKTGQLLQFILPPEPGVYYISDIALYPK